MNKILFFTCCLVISSLAFSQVKPPAKEVTCRACHGAGGAAPIAPNYPKLNGQNKAYLTDALQAYRAGNRKGGLAAAMTSQASLLSDAEIEALAAYYSAQ